jgi:hypothetical protein
MTQQASLPRLFEGDFSGKIVRGEYGTGNNGKPSARVVLEIADGPRVGTQVTYEANFKAESIKYTKRDLIAAGWQGKTMATFVDDIARRAGTVVPFNVRIASYTNPETGKLREWNSVGSIGNVAPPLSAPTSAMTQNVDSWFAEVEEPQAQRATADETIPF